MAYRVLLLKSAREQYLYKGWPLSPHNLSIWCPAADKRQLQPDHNRHYGSVRELEWQEFRGSIPPRSPLHWLEPANGAVIARVSHVNARPDRTRLVQISTPPSSNRSAILLPRHPQKDAASAGGGMTDHKQWVVSFLIFLVGLAYSGLYLLARSMP